MTPRLHTITHTTRVHASAEIVWHHITEVDIAAFSHPPILRLLDVPKPTHAEVTHAGEGGARIAYFANGLRFTQTITAWQPCHSYVFTFQPDPGFRVGYLLDLADGPFQMKTGAYEIEASDSAEMSHVTLSLTSTYQLRGIAGSLLALPVRAVLSLFQRYLLHGIRANAERDAHGGSHA